MMLRASSVPFGAVPAYTYAALPVATSVPNGFVAFASDLGTNGSLLQSNGTRWRALNGSSVLKAQGAASGNIGNSETIVLQTLIPIGAWQTNDVVRIWTSMTKSGTTDTGNVVVRVGTLGTTGDTAIIASTPWLAAAQTAGGNILDLKLASATTVQRTGSNAGGAGTYGPANATAAPAAVTITSAAANALWVSLGILSGGATNTVLSQDGQIQLITL